MNCPTNFNKPVHIDIAGTEEAWQATACGFTGQWSRVVTSASAAQNQ